MAVTFCVKTTISKGVNGEGVNDKDIDEIVDGNKKNKEIIDVEEFSDKFSKTDNLFSTFLQQIIPKSSRNREGETDKTKGKLLEELFKKAYKDDEVVKEIINAKTRGLRKLPKILSKKGIVLSMRDLKIKSE